VHDTSSAIDPSYNMVSTRSESVEPEPILRPNRRSATSLQDLLTQMVDTDGMRPHETMPNEEAPIPRRQISATSLQALLEEVEDNIHPTTSNLASSTTVDDRPLTRNHHSVSSLQRLLDAAGDPESPSLIPASGVYSTTPVSFIRTSVLSASFGELLNENGDEGRSRIPRPPFMRRRSSNENLVTVLDDALDAVDLLSENPLENSRRELAEALDDVLDCL
jgi:hypothetical protein